MKSAPRGRRTSAVEIGNVSKHGFWILIGDVEHFVPFAKFPWFRDIPIGQLLNVQLPHPHHLYWPDVDVDLAVESIIHPEKYPLLSQARPRKAPTVKGPSKSSSRAARSRSRA